MQNKELKKSSDNSTKYLVFAGVLLLAFALILSGSQLLQKQITQKSKYNVDLLETTCSLRFVSCENYNSLTKIYAPVGCQTTEKTICENGCFYSSSSANPGKCINQCTNSSGNLMTFADGSKTFYREVFSLNSTLSSGNGYNVYSYGSFVFVSSSASNAPQIKVFRASTGALVSTIDIKGTARWATINAFVVTARGVFVLKTTEQGKFLEKYTYSTSTGRQLFSINPQIPNDAYNYKIYTANDGVNLYLSYIINAQNSRNLIVNKFDTSTKVFAPLHNRLGIGGQGIYELSKTGDAAFIDSNKKLVRYTASGTQLPAVNLGTFIYENNIIYERTLPYSIYVTVTINPSIDVYEKRILKINPSTSAVVQTIVPPPISLTDNIVIGSAGTVFISSDNTISKYNSVAGTFANYAVRNVQFVPVNNTYTADGSLQSYDLDNYGNLFVLNRKSSETIPKLRKYRPC